MLVNSFTQWGVRVDRVLFKLWTPLMSCQKLLWMARLTGWRVIKEKQTARVIHENTQLQDNSKWRVTVKIMEFWKLFLGGPCYTIILLIDSPLMWLDPQLVFHRKNEKIFIMTVSRGVRALDFQTKVSFSYKNQSRVNFGGGPRGAFKEIKYPISILITRNISERSSLVSFIYKPFAANLWLENKYWFAHSTANIWKENDLNVVEVNFQFT